MPDADILDTEAAIEAWDSQKIINSTNGSVTTKPTIAYGTAAALGQFPYLVSLQ